MVQLSALVISLKTSAPSPVIVVISWVVVQLEPVRKTKHGVGLRLSVQKNSAHMVSIMCILLNLIQCKYFIPLLSTKTF